MIYCTDIKTSSLKYKIIPVRFKTKKRAHTVQIELIFSYKNEKRQMKIPCSFVLCKKLYK